MQEVGVEEDDEWSQLRRESELDDLELTSKVWFLESFVPWWSVWVKRWKTITSAITTAGRLQIGLSSVNVVKHPTYIVLSINSKQFSQELTNTLSLGGIELPAPRCL